MVFQLEFVPALTLSSPRGGIAPIDDEHPMLVIAAVETLEKESGEVQVSFMPQAIQPSGMTPNGKIRVRMEALPPPALVETMALLPQ